MGEREAAGQVRHSHTQKPLSITVIALYLLFGACVMPINVFAHAPAFFLGIDFEGIKAAIFFLTMGGLDAVIGIALLRTARWSRTLAICFLCFRAANMAVTFLVPASRVRFEEGVLAIQQAMGLGSARPESPVWFGPAVELTIMALAIWFLHTRKGAFTKKAERLAA